MEEYVVLLGLCRAGKRKGKMGSKQGNRIVQMKHWLEGKEKGNGVRGEDAWGRTWDLKVSKRLRREVVGDNECLGNV